MSGHLFYLGFTISRWGTLGIVLLLLLLVATACIKRRARVLPALFGLGLGALLVTLSLHSGFLSWVQQTTFLFRIRVMMGLLSVTVIAITFESIRISRLRERFALLWLGTGFMVLLVALFPQMIEFSTQILGVQYVTAVVGVVFTFLLLVSFHFSIALSGLEADRAKIAQRCALLELRIQAIEDQMDSNNTHPSDRG